MAKNALCKVAQSGNSPVLDLTMTIRGLVMWKLICQMRGEGAKLIPDSLFCLKSKLSLILEGTCPVDENAQMAKT